MSDAIGDLSYKELQAAAAEDVLTKLLTGQFKSIQNLVYNAVELGVRWGTEQEKRRNAERQLD